MLGYKESQVVSEFEIGKGTPAPDTFQRILTITRQPTHFFLREMPSDLKTSRVLFRSMRSLDEIARARAEVTLMWLAEYVRYLRTFVELPTLDLPDFSDMPREPREITDNHIREVARRLRKHWKLGRAPLPNLVNLLEANGFVIHMEAFDSHKWDAVSFWDQASNTPLILLNTDKPSYFRLRYNLLHELFHLLFHRYAHEELRDSKEYDRLLERQAHLFAGEMGLPHDAFPVDLYATNLDALRVIKLKWGMAIGAMIHRLHDLKITNDKEDRNLWTNYNRRKWRNGEPLDSAHQLEQPTIVHKTVQLIAEHQVQTVEDMRAEGIFSEETQERFAGMGEAFWIRSVPGLKIHKLYG